MKAAATPIVILTSNPTREPTTPSSGAVRTTGPLPGRGARIGYPAGARPGRPRTDRPAYRRLRPGDPGGKDLLKAPGVAETAPLGLGARWSFLAVA